MTPSRAIDQRQSRQAPPSDRNSPTHGLAVALCVVVAALSGMTGCGAAEDPGFPWLDTLDAGKDVKASGVRLMALPYGLHRVDRGKAGPSHIVGVHGFRSEGYEWVYPLQTLAGNGSAVHFFRWDWTTCPNEAALALGRALADLHPGTAGHTQAGGAPTLRVVGHSAGGVVVAHLVAGWKGATAIDAHTIAAPLGLGDESSCPSPGIRDGVPGGATLHQWRTLQALDGAFRDLEVDPQDADIPGSEVTRLPELYRGNRLGHNWAVSYVADELNSLWSQPTTR